jgi:hypothetical protein
VPQDFQGYLEKIYGDRFAETTREVAAWEKQFGVVFAEQYDTCMRRKLLSSFWQINKGGQGKDYLLQILQLISPDFQIVENLPVRDPRDSNAVYAAVNGNKKMVNGNKYAVNGYKIGDSDFIPTVLKNDSESFYELPSVPDYWRNCFFICKSVIRNRYKAQEGYSEATDIELQEDYYEKYKILTQEKLLYVLYNGDIPSETQQIYEYNESEDSFVIATNKDPSKKYYIIEKKTTK